MKDVKLGGGLQFSSNEISVKIKKLSDNAVVPAYSRSGDAGMDITATSMTETDQYIEYGTSLSVAIPEGYVGLIYPRSSLSKYDIVLANHVGVIDSNYRGEITFRFKPTKTWDDFSDHSVVGPKYYNIGDRIGQIIIQKIPEVTFEVAEELDETVRGTGAYGSSGV